MPRRPGRAGPGRGRGRYPRVIRDRRLGGVPEAAGRPRKAAAGRHAGPCPPSGSAGGGGRAAGLRRGRVRGHAGDRHGAAGRAPRGNGRPPAGRRAVDRAPWAGHRAHGVDTAASAGGGRERPGATGAGTSATEWVRTIGLLVFGPLECGTCRPGTFGYSRWPLSRRPSANGGSVRITLGRRPVGRHRRFHAGPERGPAGWAPEADSPGRGSATPRAAPEAVAKDGRPRARTPPATSGRRARDLA